MLKNRFFTAKVVPTAAGSDSVFLYSEPSMQMRTPNSSSARRVVNSTWATAAIEAKASPRKPLVCK